MFESLTDRFEGILSRIRSRGRLTEADVDEILREIRTALLEADVELRVVRDFTRAVRERTVGLDMSQSLSPGQQVIKIVHEELTGILGGETLKITYAGPAAHGCASGRPPGLRQDDDRGQAGPLVQAAGPQPAAGRRRPAAPGRRRAARESWAPRSESPSSASRPIRSRWPRRAWTRPSASAATS